MDQDPPPPPPPRRASSTTRFAAGTTSGSPFRGPTSSPMLTVSSSSSAHSRRRRYSTSLYPPPLLARLASGSAIYGLSSRFQFRQQIPPCRPRTTPRALPTPFLSELAEVRRVGATLFGDLDTPAATRRHATRPALYGGQNQNQLALAWPPSSVMPRRSFAEFAPPPSAGMRPPQPSRRFSGFPSSSTPLSSSTYPALQPGVSRATVSDFAPPVFRPLHPPPAGIMPPLPGGISSEFQSPAELSSRLAPLPGGCGMIWSESPSPAMQQQQAQPSFSTPLVPPPACSAIFSGFAPPPATQQQQLPANSSSFTDLAPPPAPGGGGIFTGSTPPPPAEQQKQLPVMASSFTDLAPLPGGCGFSSELTPSYTANETTMFGSSSRSPADMATAASDTVYYGHAQPSSSDSELPPFHPSLQMQPEYQEQTPSFWQQSSGNNSYGTETATIAYATTESEEPRLQAPTHQLLQVKEETVFDEAAPCLDPVYVALDDEDDKIFSALLQSLQSSTEPGASLPDAAPLSSDGWLQPGGCGEGPSGFGDVEASGESWDAMLTPSSMYSVVNTSGGSSSGSGGGGGFSIPMNCDDGSMAKSQQQQIPPQQGDQFSMSFCDMSQKWQLSQTNISGFVQPQPNQQTPLLPSSTDSLLQMISSSPSPSIWSNADAEISGQGWAGLPALGNMFHQMSIIAQGGTATPAAAGQYGTPDFDNSGSSSNAWMGMGPFASNFEEMSTGGGSMSIGQGFPGTQAPVFDITGSSSSTAWASMQLNFSGSNTMDSSIPREPKLRLGGLEEKPRLPRRTPLSLTAGASSSGMSRRGAYGDFFSEADMVTINKDKRLKVMVNTDPKRVKRILNNRASVAKLGAQRHAEFLDVS